LFINGGVNVGGRVISDNPVQVDILTGDIASNYESRDSALLPVNLWSNSSYTPVSTVATAQSIAGTATTVWLYNPGAANLTVNYTTRDGGGSLVTTPLTVGVRRVDTAAGHSDGSAHFAAASCSTPSRPPTRRTIQAATRRGTGVTLSRGLPDAAGLDRSGYRSRPTSGTNPAGTAIRSG
jgi:hypothetical protein